MASDLQPSAALRALLDAKLDTLEKLELALALQDAPGLAASVDDLALHLQVGREVLRQVAAEVTRTGLFEIHDEAIQLRADAEEAALLDEAKELYHHDRHAMLRLLSAVAMERIRRRGAMTFADAFKLKTKDRDRG
ncbi:MAG: hypothetical protein M3680_15410 [Myxococcota bacterium]|nr:hypothetical protein [Myxococcota bacterium]